MAAGQGQAVAGVNDEYRQQPAGQRQGGRVEGFVPARYRLFSTM